MSNHSWYRYRAKILTLLIGISLAMPSFSWDELAHRAIAQMSLYYLSDDSKALLQEIYGEDDYLDDYVRGSLWADLEASREGQQWQQRYHYVFFELGDSEFDAKKHCPNNQCAIAGILESRRILTMNNRSQSERIQALNYITHLIADIHQPMNAGNVRDEGGLKILLERPDLIKVNLRWVWEKDLTNNKAMRWFALSNSLRQNLDDENKELWSTGTDITAWLMETRNVAVNSAYAFALEGKYDSSYISNAMPIYEQQLQKAALRTAAFINELSQSTGTP